MVQSLTRQLAALLGRLEASELRIKKLEDLFGSARAKVGRLTPEEWMARRRKVVADLNAKRWGGKKSGKKGRRR